MGERKGFTLIEMMAVMLIVGLLAATLTTAVRSGFQKARQADCKSKLRQICVAISLYRGEHDDRVPDWTASLYPEYITDSTLFRCAADKNHGRDTPVPQGYLTKGRDPGNFYKTPTTWDNEKNSLNRRAVDMKIKGSYCYEFSAAIGTSGWPVSPNLPQHERTFNTMGQYKRIQMMYGDGQRIINSQEVPWSPSEIPILRCCHHWNDLHLTVTPNGNRLPFTPQPLVINVAYAGNVYASSPKWEDWLAPKK